MVMIKARLFAVAVLLSFAFTFSGLAVAQEDSPTPVNMAPAPPDVQQTAPPEALPPGIVRPQGIVITPSSVSTPGKGAHTNYKIFVPAGHQISDNFFYRYYWSNITYFASAGD